MTAHVPEARVDPRSDGDLRLAVGRLRARDETGCGEDRQAGKHAASHVPLGPRRGRELGKRTVRRRSDARKRASAWAFWTSVAHLDLLVLGVEADAARAEPVDGGDAHRVRGAGVGAAADERGLAAPEARGLRGRAVALHEPDARLGALEREARDAALDLDTCTLHGCGALVGGLPQRLDERLAVGARLEAEVDERLGAIGHGVLARAARDLADVDGDAARVVGERLRAIDELRERPQRVGAFLVGVAGVRGLAVRR